jgi:DNA-binding NarL/FixJ family response regulator
MRLVAPGETRVLIAESRALREQSRELRKDLQGSLDQLLNTVKRSIEVTAKIAVSSERLQRLTRRECSVLILIAAGYSTKQLAGRLGISFKTAVSHRTHIMEKLEIHDIAGLTRFAIRHDLVRA